MGQIVNASIKCIVASVDTFSNATMDSERVAMDSERVDFQDEPANDGVSSRKPSNVKKRTYCKLHVTPEFNPHFANGVWYVKHVLNHKSALLKKSVRQRIIEIGGWPSEIDSYSKIRNSMADNVQGIVSPNHEAQWNGLNLTPTNQMQRSIINHHLPYRSSLSTESRT
jgi:hypothetical protein